MTIAAAVAAACTTSPAQAQVPRICGQPFNPTSSSGPVAPRPTSLVPLAPVSRTAERAAAGPTSLGAFGLVSRTAAGRSANRASGGPTANADGRFVAFHSVASNLVADDRNRRRDVFVRDRQTGVTELVSISSAEAQGNGASSNPWLSGDGRFVLFLSTASTLVHADTNGKLDAFVRDRLLGTTIRASVGAADQQANAATLSARLSLDGNVVLFATAAGNLTPGDTNGQLDLFIRDLAAGSTTRPEISNLGRQPNGGSHPGSLSADGSLLAFRSHASNLVAGDSNREGDDFVYDRTRGRTERINVSSAGAQANGPSYRPTLTNDGRLVVFRSGATNLVGGDTNGQVDVFVHNRAAGTTRRVNIPRDGGQTNGLTARPSISGNGRYVAFASLASNLVPNDRNGDWDVFLRDRRAGTTIMVSRTAGGRPANSCSKVPRLSADGSLIVFKTLATNLVPRDRNRADDVVARRIVVP
jgi:Tol biopolymer transport system component